MSLFSRLQPQSGSHLEREWDCSTSWLQHVHNIPAWKANCYSVGPHGQTSDGDLLCCQRTGKWLPDAAARSRRCFFFFLGLFCTITKAASLPLVICPVIAGWSICAARLQLGENEILQRKLPLINYFFTATVPLYFFILQGFVCYILKKLCQILWWDIQVKPFYQAWVMSNTPESPRV